MKLQTSKSKNVIIYYAAESYRKNGKVSTRVIEKIGSHQELLDLGIANPKEYAKQRVDEINKNLKDNILSINQTINFNENLDPTSSIISQNTSQNIGWLYIHKIYEKLGVKSFLDTLSGKTKYDLNAITEYFVANRFLFPGSKREAFLNKDKLFASPNYALYDGYRALTPLDTYNKELQKALFEGTKSIVDLDTNVLYYDCTNFYFECEEQDDNLYNEDGDIIQWGLRRYGASKEHRPNPIVQMGLFTDKNGIPMSYCVHHGSNNEQNTVIPLEQRMIREYNTSRFIYCSDGGLGSFDNRFFNTLQRRDYVVTQSLKKTPKKELEYIFKDVNWRYLHPIYDQKGKEIYPSLTEFKRILDKKYKGEMLTPEEEMIISRDMIYKEYPIQREIPAKFLKAMRLSGKLLMDETIYISFSAKYYLYQKNLLDRQIENAKNWMQTKDVETIKKGPNDVRRLIETISSTKEGEIAEFKDAILDEERIAYEKEFHGFYAIATSIDDASFQEILDINASRWKIEQSFRILKTDFDTRPIYASSPEHIRGHLAVCYIALLIYRILERKLLLLGDSTKDFSSTKILETIRNMNVIEHQDSFFESIYTDSLILESLEKILGCGLNKKYYKAKSLQKKFDS